MEIKGKNILVLGGWGLVGTAICRVLIERGPASITIASLTREQAESACEELGELTDKVKFFPEWGNIFVRNEMKDLTRDEILGSRENRLTLAEDVLEQTPNSLQKFFLHDMIMRRKPDIVVDCVNTATGVAYQDVYSAGLKVLKDVKAAHKSKNISDDLLTKVETLLDSLYLPQLVRHVQVIYNAMKTVKTKSYVKVGTSGTGGMGLNIPYTHSEDKPSRVLLSKTSVAGAHSLLLFLMARTPDAPYVKEVKPATAIAWKGIKHGEILKGGNPIPLFDCPPENAISVTEKFDTKAPDAIKPLGKNLEGVFIDTGENGTFSLGEFTAITTSEQMEYITPEEIAQTVLWEIEGGASGHDVVGAIDASILTSTYRAGIMRSLALEKMNNLVEEHQDGSVAYELLGPPRLSKLLWEAHLLKRAASSIDNVLATSAEELSTKIAELVKSDMKLRSRIVSIGIPILLPDGKQVLRGSFVKVPQDPRKTVFDATQENINHWCETGWLDLRVSNIEKWHDRLNKLLSHAKSVAANDTSSHSLRDMSFWHTDKPLNEGEIVGWLFIEEDEGRRMK